NRTFESPVYGDDCNWNKVIEFTVTDSCGNDYPPFKVILSGRDQTAPEWNVEGGAEGTLDTIVFDMCPQDVVPALKVGDVLTPPNGGYVIQNGGGAFWIRILLGADATDNCTAWEDLRMVVNKVDLQKGDCETVLSYTFELLDECDNSGGEITCIWTFIDSTDPTASAPADEVYQCADDVPAADIKMITDASDNCNEVTVTHEGDVSDQGFPIENITRTYRVEDACGNFILVSHNIKVEDTIAPEIECPGDIVVDFPYVKRPLTSPADFSGSATHIDLSAMNYPNPIGNEYAGQGVNFTSPSGFLGGLHPNGSYALGPDFAPNATMNINFDSKQNRFGFEIYEADNVNTQITLNCLIQGIVVDSQTIDVGGTPTFVGMETDGGFDQIVLTTGNPNTVNRFLIQNLRFEGGVVVNYTAPTSYSDNCSPNSYLDTTVELVEGLASGSAFPIGDTVVRYRVTDESGNDATCTFTVTVNGGQQAPPAAPEQGVEETVSLDFRAYPVPFNKDVNLNYNFKFDTDVTIEIYDTKGLMVQRQVNKGYKAGSDVTLPMTINGADQLYYVKLITNRGTVTKKIVSSSTNKR
ncbi:HYR domain-containing protein, partial [Flavobacteriaceae sp. LMIT009]